METVTNNSVVRESMINRKADVIFHELKMFSAATGISTGEVLDVLMAMQIERESRFGKECV